MAILLLIIIYMCFIGLGLPDSIFGSCWPAMREELNLPVSYANYVTTLITACTMVSTLFSAKLINKLGTGWVTVISTLATAVGLMGFSLSDRYLYLLLLALPLGFGAGAIDSALNNYVAVHYKASHMSYLHSFYGLGVFLSPVIMSYALKYTTWKNGYGIVAIIQFAIAFLALLAIPLWGKVKGREENQEVVAHNPIKEVIKIKPMKFGLFILMASCSIEFLCGTWGATYLVGAKNMSTSISAFAIGIYYLGMTLGRFLSGVVSKKLTSFAIITLGMLFVVAGILLVLFNLSFYFCVIGLFLIGFGNGPVFPNMTHLAPKLYGKENSQSIISLQMVSCYFGVTLVPFVFGFLAKDYLHIFPYLLLVFYAWLVFSIILLVKSLKKYQNDNKIVDN